MALEDSNVAVIAGLVGAVVAVPVGWIIYQFVKSQEFTPEQREEFHRMGDVNRDGVINQTDLDLVNAAYGKTGAEAPDCDLNGDGKVDMRDVGICTQNQGLTIQEWVKHG